MMTSEGRGTKKLPVVGIAERKGGVAAEAFDGKSLSNKNFKEMLKRARRPSPISLDDRSILRLQGYER